MEKKRGRAGLVIVIFLLIILILAGAVYALGVNHYQKYFFPNTTVNGVDYSGKTAEYLKEKNSDTAEDYLLTIYDRDGNKYLLKGPDFSYAYVDNGEEEKLLAMQDAMVWPLEMNQEHSYTMESSYTFDEEALEKAIYALDLMDEESYVAPADAYLAQNEEGTYEIVEEVYGSTLIEETVIQQITDAVSAGLTEYTLGDDCYECPEVLSTDESFAEILTQIDAYCAAEITYDIEGADQVLTSATISTWIVLGSDGSVSIDENAVANYVQSLATAYNTYGDVRSFQTSLGDIIEIGGGDYGWVIDKSGEAAQILEDLEGGVPVTREPVYEQTAMVSGADDIGTTYIELDYTNQHLYYYEESELILESDFVSGKLSNGNGSPDGVFKIVYKQKDATLVGEDYSSSVNYFLPFAYNVGIHDASWRSSFGGEIYKTSGSHGCINAPYDVAKQLYELVEVGTPVVAYYRESVELTSESSGISNAYSYVSTEE